MEPDYHALEFDLRLWLCGLDFAAPDAAPVASTTRGPVPCR